MKKSILLLSVSIGMSSLHSNLVAETKHYELGLEETMVTAQRWREDQQQVPLSITSLSGKSFNELNAAGEDIQVLANRVPALYVESSNGRIAPRFYMRGLGNVDFDLAASQPVSIIFDDVVQENVVLKSFPLFDIDQVEVIRGPQGTLFGRNTNAGIVKFSSRKPTEETEGYLSASYGTFDSINIESAIGGTLIDDKLMARVSLLSQRRDDWIDNRFLEQKNAFGGFDERAGRVQFLLTPNEKVSLLLNYHLRDLDGSQTAFQANVFTTGSNKLNKNYHRDAVFYDGGNNNQQKYKSSGGSLTLEVNLDAVEVTAITAIEKAKGKNRGDIDGGVAGVGPGLIPFSSDTTDKGDVRQFTQEIRLSNMTDGQWDWQVGAFYFDSELDVTTDAGFNIATVQHENTSWAVFAHNRFQFSDAFELAAGIRYTDDERTFESEGINSIDLSDDEISWDINVNYMVSDAANVYARVASGFRAQSVQGRDVAFFGQPSVADSETILSYELGIKSDWFQNKVRINAAIFYYTIDDMQLSAIGGLDNRNRLLNADKGVGQGIEIDVDFVPTDDLKISLGASYNDTEIKDGTLFTTVCGSGQCTPTDTLDGLGNARVDGNPFQGAPKTMVNLSVRYQFYRDGRGLWYFSTDWAYQGETNLALYESKEFVTDDQFEGGLRFGYENTHHGYEYALFVRNITDEDNVKGFVDFNNNTGFVNEPRLYGAQARYRF